MPKNKRNCIVKKLCEDNTSHEYGIDQNLSMYIKKRGNIAWETFWENRLTLKNEKNYNMKKIYTHTSGIEFDINKEGEFYKRKRNGLWTAFVKKHEVPIMFDIGRIVATKADHYWVEYDEETIIKYQVIRAKKGKSQHMKGYNNFVVADRIQNQEIIEKVVFDNSTVEKAVNILLNKE